MIEVGNDTIKLPELIRIALSVDPIKKTKFTFFLIVLNALWSGILFTIKLRLWFQILPRPVAYERFDEWTDEHLLITISTYNSWNIFQLPLTHFCDELLTK